MMMLWNIFRSAEYFVTSFSPFVFVCVCVDKILRVLFLVFIKKICCLEKEDSC